MFSKSLTPQQDLCSLINNTIFTVSKHDYMYLKQDGRSILTNESTPCKRKGKAGGK